jgi:N-acetylneuraminate synthase/N,N'-diacetyllegionaminate synthase
MTFEFSRQITIADRIIGEGRPVFIIAEAGVAHFGSLDKAKALVDLAVKAGADAVKFQIFDTHALISQAAPDWIARLKSRELPYEAFEEIAAYCRAQGIIFLATAHDAPSLAFLRTLNVPAYKIGSGEVANWAYIAETAALGRPVILSTGMYRFEDIGQALKQFRAQRNPHLAVLHCVTQYPTPSEAVNLRAIQTIADTFGVISGYSDHTAGFHFALAAVALGAKIVEKHIGLDFNVPNAQDWKVACGPETLKPMIDQIRAIEAGLGSGRKEANAGEQDSLKWARKSLVAARSIQAGEYLAPEMLAIKRPGTGLAPDKLDQILGRRVKRAIKKDQLIEWGHLH